MQNHNESNEIEGRGGAQAPQGYLHPGQTCSRWLRCSVCFYAIVMAMNGRFEMAADRRVCALVLDSLDGVWARMTNTQSAFGETDGLAVVGHGVLRRRSRLDRL